MLNFQSIVQQLSHHENESLLMTVGIPVIRAQEQMLALGKVLVPYRDINFSVGGWIEFYVPLTVFQLYVNDDVQ